MHKLKKLNTELYDLFVTLQPFKHEIDIKKFYINILKNQIQSKMPDFQLFVYGSFACNLSLKHSDIDITLVKNEDEKIITKGTQKKYKRRIKRMKYEEKEINEKLDMANMNGSIDTNTSSADLGALEIEQRLSVIKIDKKRMLQSLNVVKTNIKNNPIEILKSVKEIVKDIEFVDKGSIILIENAKVPVLKFKDTKYKISFDFTINKDEAQKQTEFVISKLKKHKNLKVYCVLLKYFLKIRNLNETFTGGLNSYGQFLLLLHFYQLHPVLQTCDVLENIAVVFLDFFQFYGLCYNYAKSAIDVMNCCYVRNYEYRSSICVLDPVCGNNVTSGCVLIEDIREVFAHCYKVMEMNLKTEDDDKSMLELWYGKNHKMLT
ncbi:Non-canonical poly(A) RNA polymerase papd5 [Binucleata daphniae]